MTEIITPTTELEAINAILASVGEAPVDSIDDSFTDAQLARNLLTQESRRLQTKGWHFNTELEVSLTPDNSGVLWLPANTLSVVQADTNIVQRGRKLYDRSRQSYEFTTGITANLIVALQFEELPEAARAFVTIRAGRRFQDRLGGDRVMHQIHANDEMAAWAAFMDYEAEASDANMLKNSPLVARMKGMR